MTAGTASALVPAAEDDQVQHPAIVWWVLVLGGLTILALDAWNADFYAWWSAHVNRLPSQAVLAWVFIGCVPLHVGEALYVYLAAPKHGLSRSRMAWTLQTFCLGYPSTRLFRKVVAARSARVGR